MAVVQIFDFHKVAVRTTSVDIAVHLPFTYTTNHLQHSHRIGGRNLAVHSNAVHDSNSVRLKVKAGPVIGLAPIFATLQKWCLAIRPHWQTPCYINMLAGGPP